VSVTHPDQIHPTFLKAVNDSDVETLTELYAADGVAIGLDGSEVTGADGMRAMIEGLAGAIRHIDGSTRTLIVAGDLSLSSAEWTAEITLPDGTVVTQSGRTAEVARRGADGTWQVVIDDPMFG
jgi:uncharacterized protein (TIGR02246 family)